MDTSVSQIAKSEKQKFSAEEAIKFGWEAFKKNKVLLILVIITSIAAAYIPTYLYSILRGNDAQSMDLIWLVYTIATYFLSALIAMGVIKISLDIVDGQKTKYVTLISQYPKVIKYLVAYLIAAVVIFAGILMLIVPSIYFAIRLQMFPYLIVDKNLGPIEAVKTSWRMTQGSVGNFIWYGACSFAVMFLGLIALVIGLIPAAAVLGIAHAYIYRKLLQN